MIKVRGFYLLIHQEITAYQLISAGFAVLLAIVAVIFWLRKMRRLREEPIDEETENYNTPAPVYERVIKSEPEQPKQPEPQPEPELPPARQIITTKESPAIAERNPIAVPYLNGNSIHTNGVYSNGINSNRINGNGVNGNGINGNGHTKHENGLHIMPTSGGINAILNSLSDIIFEYDDNKVCLNLWYNKTIPMALDLEVFRGKTVTEAIGPENAKIINEALDFVAANGISTTIEFPSFMGSGKWFQSHVSPVFDADGNFTGRTTSLVTDISEQKKYATELKEKQQQLLEAQKIARLGDWWYDLKLKQTSWSDNLYALLEIEHLPKNTSHFEYYISRVQADDRRGVYQFFNDFNGDKYQENTHKILTSKNNLRYFRIVRGEPFRDEQGDITRVTGIIQDITETRVIERNIKKSKAELLEAQTIAKIGNWKWSVGQKNISWSDEVYHIHEVDPNPTAQGGLCHFKLLLKYVHPDDKLILLGFLKSPINLRRTSSEYRIITPKGNLKYVNIIIAKVKEDEQGKLRQVIGTLQDITERKKAEINIQKTEDNYKLVLETIKLAAVSLDKNGNVIFCNTYLANLLGYTQKQLIGMNWYENFVPENLRSVFDGWYQSNNISSNYINPIICKDGEQRVISWQNTTVYDENGLITQTTSIGEDVTDQQKDRQQLISDKEKAERSSLFKSEFLSTMSHEIRTPMNAVIGTTNLLLEENPRPDQLAYLNNLKFSGENLLGIIDDILDYNKIEAGKLELSKQQVNIHQLAANIKQSFQAKAMEKKLEIVVEMDKHIPNNLIGDPIRLGQILNNLVSNGIKFTHKGAITILIREEGRTGDRVTLNFTVADTGIGIEAASLEKIFEPFVQESQHRDYGGSGLGLAIIRRLVQLHGSHIKANSTLGKGTQFNFVIEFEYAAEPVNKPQLNAIQKMQEADLSGMRVLVVDDNKMNILIASRFLNKWNVTISEANNGLVATEMVADNAYDLIIMDLQMPVMDGFEATQKIKVSHPDMPVIALTADAMPETYEKARECGMDDYLTKPFMPEILFEKVSRYYKAIAE
jgi:two-component system sensor histidine kinase/response regulator